MAHHQALQNVIEDQVCLNLSLSHSHTDHLSPAESSSNTLSQDTLPRGNRHIQEDTP